MNAEALNSLLHYFQVRVDTNYMQWSAAAKVMKLLPKELAFTTHYLDVHLHDVTSDWNHSKDQRTIERHKRDIFLFFFLINALA